GTESTKSASMTTCVEGLEDRATSRPRIHAADFGFSPMCAFVDHGEHGTGEVLALDLRPGSASPFNAVDHIACLDAALTQLPDTERGQVLVRAAAGGGSKAFLHLVT